MQRIIQKIKEKFLMAMKIYIPMLLIFILEIIFIEFLRRKNKALFLGVLLGMFNMTIILVGLGYLFWKRFLFNEK